MKSFYEVFTCTSNVSYFRSLETVTNRFSGKEYKLTAEELSMYDFIMGAQIIMEMGSGNEQAIMEMRRGLDWFRKNNSKAYMVLLD